MKPSASKAAVAARQRKSRALKKERAEKTVRHAAQMDALPVAERIQIDQITKQVGIDRVAQKKARAAALIALAEREALKEPLRTVTVKDGRIVEEYIEIPEAKPRPPEPAPVAVQPTTKQRRGEGDPTAPKKVLIQRQGSMRKEWCDRYAIPTGAHVFEHQQREELADARRSSMDPFALACMIRNAREYGY